MLMLDFLAEQRIAEAVSRGELDQLPGQGRPLPLDHDPLMPEDLRVAYRILKNGGFVPAEAETLNEIAQLERFVAADAGGHAAAPRKALRKLGLFCTPVARRYSEQALWKLSA